MDQLSYVSNPRKNPYIYTSIPDIIRKNAVECPGKEILIHRSRDKARHAITYQELEERATRFAGYLINHGAKRGTDISILGMNTIEWAIAELAILKTGSVSVHISISTKDAGDAFDILVRTESKMIILDPGLQMELMEIMRTLIEKINQWNKSNQDKQLKIILLRHMNGFEKFFYSERNSTEIKLDTVANLVVYPEDTAVIFATSGSTGQSKLVQCSHFMMINTIDTKNDQEEFATNDMVFFNDRPFAWIGGSPLLCFISKATRIFTDVSESSTGEHFLGVWNMMKEEKCKYALMMPYFLFDICNWKEKNEDRDEYRLEAIFIGGQRIDETCKRAFGKICESIFIGYGSTEVVSATLAMVIANESFPAGYVGSPRPGVEIKLIDANGDTVALGNVGNVCIRSLTTTPGYYKNPEQNTELFAPGGWVRMGDIGSMDENYNLTIHGRSKDVISRGGRKILPGLVEDSVMQMEGIEQVSVISVPDARLYEEICVCYVTKPDRKEIGNDAVEEFCKTKFLNTDTLDNIGETPKYFIRLDDLPTLSSGKIDKIFLKKKVINALNLNY